MEGLISKMRNLKKSTRPSFRRRENAAAIVKAPPPDALTNGPDRKFPGLHPPPGGATSPFLSTNRRFAFPILALLAALAVGLLFLLPGGLLQAQDDGPIMYAENGTDPVATFTGTDPEERMVYWSLTVAEVDGVVEAADIAGLEHFMINSDGVLSFKFPPDYETTPAPNVTGNTYKVVVEASDDALGAGDMIKMGYKKVTVMVTDVDEPGMVALSSQQPQVGQPLTATLTDDDATSDQITAATWVWERTSAMGEDYTVIIGATAANYPPVAGVVGNYLRAKATYTDRHGSEKTAMMVSAYKVRALPPSNAAPDAGTAAREVEENSPPGTNVGKPVTATDPNSDVLTYSLGSGDDEGNYRIDPGTGQITVGPRAMLDHEAEDREHTVMVTATDPSDVTGTVTVTVTIKDVNEAPMITGGPTKISNKMEDDADVVDTDDETVQMVGTYMATDPESEGTDAACVVASCIWSLKGTDLRGLQHQQCGGSRGFLWPTDLQGSPQL